MSVNDVNLIGRCIRSYGSKAQVAAWERIRTVLLESRPTVRSKRPAQQAKERNPNRFMGNGYYNY